ncbi:MAG: REP-associated tyrosine transposase [Planctomycetota bacterium]|jgi:REP element-mobilizing transposase RayT
MEGPGSKALRKGRCSVPGAAYLITKNTRKEGTDILVRGENPIFIINWFFTAQEKNWLDLLAFVVMPNHYHLAMTLGKNLSLSKAIGRINENAALLIKKAEKNTEDILQDGFHDHLIRPTERHDRYIEYVHNNPVESGLVNNPEDWLFSSAHPMYRERVKKR